MKKVFLLALMASPMFAIMQVIDKTQMHVASDWASGLTMFLLMVTGAWAVL